MALYILGDPHLSFSVDKPMDIFGERWKNHAEKIKEKWLKTILPEDTVILAGDISWGISLEEAKADLEFLHCLPGKKVLLRGNHDYWWETVSKMERFFTENEWEDFVFLHNNCIVAEGVAICGTRGWSLDAHGEQDRKVLHREVQRLEMSLKAAPAALKKIAIFHFPPVENNESPFFDVLKKYGVSHCYFGHLHGPSALGEKVFSEKGISFHLISGDALDFQPRSISNDLKGIFRRKSMFGQNNQKNIGFFRKLFYKFKTKC